MVGGNLLHGLRLLLHAVGRAVKLHQQHGRLAEPQLGIGVDHAHRIGVDQLDPGNGYAHLNDGNGGLYSRLNAGERTHGSRHRFWQGVQAQGDLGDHAQRALAAHHQARQVVACARFLGARASAYHLSAGGHHFQGQHVLAHGAVAHRVGATGAGGAHAPNAGVGAGVNRKKQAGTFDLFVELLAGHAGLHGHGQIFCVDTQHLVHATHVQADAALHRQQMPFQRGAHAKRNDRRFVARRQRHGICDVLGAFGIHHGGRRWHAGERRLVTAMLLTHHQRGGAVSAEALGQGVKQGLGHLALGHQRGQVVVDCGGVHGRFSPTSVSNFGTFLGVCLARRSVRSVQN